MKASLLTGIMHSRGMGYILGLMSLLCAVFFFSSGHCEEIVGDKGMVLPSANSWIALPWLDFCAAMTGSALTLTAMWLLNKVYNVFRSVTWLYISFFGVMQLATPSLYTQFYTGTLLAILVPTAMLLLFSRYRSADASHHVFLVFLLLSLATATQYAFAFYIPVFALGCVQMQIFNRRTLIAGTLGLITPWWIMLGFGLISPEEIHAPEFNNIFTQIDFESSVLLLVTIGFTSLLLLVCHLLNVFKTIAYNARSRSINGLFAITGFVTIVAMCIDYRSIISYIPLLNFCASMAGAHFFATHRADKSFIAILLIIAVYAALFVCQTVI